MSNLITRTLTGIVFVALIILSALYSTLAFTLLFFVFTILGINEFYKLVENHHYKPLRWMGCIGGALIFLLVSFCFLHIVPIKLLFLTPTPLFVLLFAELYRKNENPIQNLALSFMGILYVAVPFALMVSLFYPGFNFTNINNHIVLGYFLLVWLNDTMAYVTGMTLGRTRLFERISPQKTWEGTIGGGVFCLAGAYVLSVFFTNMNSWQWMVMAVVIVVTANLGDLTESLFKRSLFIKDSGTFFPGHGGILDRFDAVFGSVPFVFAYIHIIFS
ncbi:MAG: phosphatidate cytidylyltransferase [Lentimicrobiaceae bacterium]|nr:phosphatidate cytidylyltransferase [Lentimicrobiaceae bacterium]